MPYWHPLVKEATMMLIPVSIRHAAGPSRRPLAACWWPARWPSRLSSGEAPPTKSRTADLMSCADLHQGLRPLCGKLRIKISALVVHHDKGREVLHCNTPDSFHAQLWILEHLDFLDAMLR